MGFDFFKRCTLVALLASSLIAVDAYGQRGERGRGRGGGGGGGEQAQSRGGGRGGGGQARSSRGGGEARSSGGGGEQARSSRGGGEARSFRGGGQARSADRGPSVSRSFQGRSGRGESFRPSGRGSIETGRSGDRSADFRSMQRGASRDRSFDAARQFDRQQFGRSQQLRDSQQRTFRTRDLDGMRSARSQSDTGPRQYEARRSSEDQVREFLRLRREGTQRQAQDFGDRSFRQGREGDRGDRDFARGEGDRFERQIRRQGQDFRRDFGDRQYRQWREGAWARDGDRRGDNRDWSGRWREGDRFASADRIRSRWRDRGRDRDWDDFPFHGNWWSGRQWHGHRWHHWDRWSRNRPWYWWTWVAAPRLFGWFDHGWQTPYYWDYGHGEYIYYDDGAIYVNGRWYQPAPVFYERTVELVDRAPELTPEQAAEMEWLPLGVFAVTREGQAEADVLVQLAVTQEGVLGGTAFDQQSSAAYPVQGIVEKETQRAVWSFTDDRNQRVVMETSIFNLTQPEATGLVHNGPNDIEVVELVRLESPEGAAVAGEELPAQQ